MSDLTHDLNIATTTWHSRWYHHWLNLTERKPSPENLCHYVRVLLFWAPLAWLTRGRVFKVVPPWTIALGILASGVLITLFMLWPNDVLRVLLIVGCFLGGALLVIGAIFIVDNGPRWARIALACVTFPIWIIPLLIVAPIVYLTDRYEKGIKAFKLWWTTPQYRLASRTPLGVLLASIAVGFLALIAVVNFSKFLELMLILVLVFVGVFLVIGGMLLLDEAQGRSRAGKPVFGEKFASISDTVKLGATYVATKKRGSRICPFIRFDDQSGVDLGKEPA